MSKRNRRDVQTPFVPPTDWETERTLEAAESDVPASIDDDIAGEPLSPGAGTTVCICGHRELLLQAYFAVVDGALSKEPLETEGLTCPECGREYEAIVLADGRIARGEFVGFAELDD